MTGMTRRAFTKTAAGAGIAAATALSAGRVLGANDRLRLGFIGLGNRGDQVLSAFLEHKDAEVSAICDIYQPYLDFAARKIGTSPEQFRDYRKLLDRRDLDAVVICTPDHWHALQMVHACQAGKDVYVEKPLSLCVAEGRAMVKAAREHKRIAQVGIQRLSSEYCKEAAELVRSGGIGKVTVVRCFHVQNEWPRGIGNPPDEDPPQDFDWEAWLGPAPKRRYNKNRSFYRFRWFYDHSGGQLTNFGVHYLAQIHRSLGVDAPRSVAAIGGKFADYDNREVPDTLEVIWHYPGDTLVTFSQFNATGAPGAGRSCEIEFRGTKGTMYFRTNGYEVVPEVITPNEFPARSPVHRELERGYRTGAKAQIEAKQVEGRILDADHARNFLDAVRSRKAPSCDIEFGHRCTSAALIANIAHKTRTMLEWDARTERSANDAANKLLSYQYREPYKLPV
jgi:predicted dehydrogenase